MKDLKQGGKLEYVKKKHWDIYREMMRSEGVQIIALESTIVVNS